MKSIIVFLLLSLTIALSQSNFPSGVKTPYVEETARNAGHRLTSFKHRKTLTALTGVTNGVSGVTYNERSGTLFVIRNASGASSHIYEMALDGTILRTITESATAGEWVDTESITWVGWDATNAADIFIIGEEENPTASLEGRLSLVRLTPAATTITRTAAGNVTVTTAYSNGTISNSGLEGQCYDPIAKKVYYTSEFRTQAGSDNTAYASGPGQWRIFQRSVTWESGTLSFGTESVLCNILPLLAGAPMLDCSDMAFDINSATILLHSHESDKVVRIAKDGTLLEQITIAMNQPEGVAIHPLGTELYVTGENQEYQRWSVGAHSGQPFSDMRTGTVTLVAGVATVTDSAVTAFSRIFVQRQTDGGTIADDYSITRTAGTSFTITAKLNSANHTTDTSTLAYWIIEP